MQLKTSVRIAEHQDGSLVLDVSRGKFFSIDPVGTLIIRWLESPVDHHLLIAKLCDTFPAVSAEELSRDLNAFLHSLARIDLLDGTSCGSRPTNAGNCHGTR